jgi:oligopeptide transport system substrate-binding protein
MSGLLPPSALAVFDDDRNTIRIELEEATPYFLELLTHPSMQIRYTKDADATNGKLWTFVTNGAYRIDEVTIGSSIALRKNKHYWNAESVKIDKVIYHIVTQEQEPIRFEAGEIDITDNVSESYFRSIRKVRPDFLRVAPTLGVYYIGINLEREPFKSSVALRKALSLSLDRTALVEMVLGRGELPAYALVPPGISEYRDEVSIQYLSQAEREIEAVKLFAQVNWPTDMRRIELRFNTGGGHERIAAAVAAMWRNVLGLDVSLRGEEFKVFLENVKNRNNVDLFRLSWIGDYDDAYTFLQVFRSNNHANLVGFENRTYDELLDTANMQTDTGNRRRLLEMSEDVLLDEGVMIPVYFYVSKHLVSNRVAGWQDNVSDVHRSQYLALQRMP